MTSLATLAKHGNKYPQRGMQAENHKLA